jgi:hypothetical protein
VVVKAVYLLDRHNQLRARMGRFNARLQSQRQISVLYFLCTLKKDVQVHTVWATICYTQFQVGIRYKTKFNFDFGLFL